ncbi:arylalkylamine N-acetyltransferase 1-like [Cloeon dipterum]|uniref:arylalkylamine N-acetyltransferase 1-like n=1 Tax=Cloeon dipterum TaxID=197152 RepID=UPI0032200737
MSSNIDFVCPLEADLYEAVMEHLRLTFFWEEPLNVCVSLCEAPGSGHPKLEAVCLDTLQDGLSIVALSDGKVVGCALNGSQSRQQLDEAIKQTYAETDKKFRSIFSMLYDNNRDIDLFTKYDVHDIFECRILSVDPDYRGKGIARILLDQSIQEARLRGFKLFKIDATSAISQRICKSRSLTLEHEILYADHLDPDTGKPAFLPPPPHYGLQIYSRLFEKE